MVETAPHPHAPDHGVFGFDPEHREPVSPPPDEVTVMHERYRVSHAYLPEKELPFVILSNLPKEVDPTERRVARIGRMYLMPSKMDELAPGEYELYGRLDDERLEPGDKAYGIEPFENHFKVFETKYGIAYSGDISGYTYHGIMSVGVSERLGMGINRNESEYKKRIGTVPSPETFKRAAYEEFGIKVRLISETTLGEIDPKSYNDAFADGEYPIQTDEESMYLHDISPDHTFAIMTGGVELMSELQAAVKRQRAEGRAEGDIAGDIDNLTMQMGVRLEHLQDRSVLDKIMNHARGLGIADEKMEEILAIAKRRMIDNLPGGDDEDE